MNIIDTIPYFMEQYKPSISFLREYYNEYPTIFKEYFTYHCKDTEERHLQSLAKYPDSLETINQVYENIIPIIHEIEEKYIQIYQITFPVEVNLIVGGYGSNAYTYRQIIPNITFALEKLSPTPNHLRSIVAHEFGHATHNILSDKAGTDWQKILWMNPLVWLNQEGAATHFSRRIVNNLPASMYFSFNDEGDQWLSFAEKNKDEIKELFAKDFMSKTPVDLFKEWFSINGGKLFGHSRLAYFICDLFFQDQVKKLGERGAITAWKEEDFVDQVKQWLLQSEK
ncbi:hypothetical protein ACFSCX_19670 [Bacillus salitolerans]|uniref:Aminopeptidase n=1 Tax=Bacillus salitolerans TaxID=1437434 RepID=A0ABW4LUA1_9BACI